MKRILTKLKGWRIRTYVKFKLAIARINGRYLRVRRLTYIFIWKRIVAPAYWRMSRDIDGLIIRGEANVEDFAIDETITPYSVDRDEWHER